MSFIEFPLRLDGPYLRRTEEPRAILQLIEAMARTPVGSWAGAPAFGARDLLETLRTRPDGLKEAVRSINSALIDLGISGYRLEGIESEPGKNPDVNTYIFRLVDASDPRRIYSSSPER
jgi:hypothetical protein